MNNLNTIDIAQALGAESLGNTKVTGINVDTRFVKEGDLFVCLIGQKVDGHTFAQEALDKGAKALLVSRKLEIDAPQILVGDTLQAFYDFAAYYRKQLDMEVIAITGSNGKTSTKDMFLSVLEKVSPTIATFKNQNTMIGSCLTLFRCDSSTRFGIFEVGLDAPGEIEEMVSLIKPTYAVLTGLDQAHMDNFEDDYKVLGKEKFSIFKPIEDKTHCFYQGDVEIFNELADGERTFGFNENNEYNIIDVIVDEDKTHFKVKDRTYSTNLLGKHQASNAAGVIALLRNLGINDRVINEGLSDVKLTEMRTEIYQHQNSLILFDAYKSSPKSLEAILDLFNDYKTNKTRYAVLSDMYMLGEGTEKQHQNALKKALSLNIEGIYLLGDEFKKAKVYFDDKRLH
ncbi:MAG TPA: UDP-N-acetylmuramoyl-tripeptide--D-alanyl-D-alanine ligase, partial [Erysipelothrix sp.]|nr:UDP-N-acetylmuramoyl-tripeptide--D-alanyl-D-alanine ligase [Erysipelothrix sp.]